MDVGMPLDASFDASFSIISTLVILGFITVFGLIIYRVVKGTSEWAANNNEPVSEEEAHIVTKRSHVEGHGGSVNHTHGHTTTSYFVTFEIRPSNERKEFKVKANAYGLLAEGDIGLLKYQGTRYLEFERVDVELNNVT